MHLFIQLFIRTRKPLFKSWRVHHQALLFSPKYEKIRLFLRPTASLALFQRVTRVPLNCFTESRSNLIGIFRQKQKSHFILTLSKDHIFSHHKCITKITDAHRSDFLTVRKPQWLEVWLSIYMYLSERLRGAKSVIFVSFTGSAALHNKLATADRH